MSSYINNTSVTLVNTYHQNYVNGTQLLGNTSRSNSVIQDMWRCRTYDFVAETVIMGILCAFGFVGNTLSMVCLTKDKSKTATPFLLVSLEVADTAFLITVVLLRVLTTITQYFELASIAPIFPYFGKYVFPCALIAEMATIYLTLLVTVNRYISVCRPYEASDLCSITHARKHVVLVAAFSVIYNLPRFFEYDIVPNPQNPTVNKVVESYMLNNKIYKIVYVNILYCVVMFLIPLLMLIILNSKLIKALRKTKRKRAQLLSSSSQGDSRSEDDITLVLIVVVLVFVICQAPALVTQVLYSILNDETKKCPGVFFYYERISDLLVVVNSSMNFIIYCFCSTKFRQILIELVCKSKSASDASITNGPSTKYRTINSRADTPSPTNNGNAKLEEIKLKPTNHSNSNTTHV